MRSEYSKWFWSECDELNKDTSFAHSLAEKAWQHQQSKVDELQKQVTDLDNRATKYALDAMATAKLNAELQKRLDAAIYLLTSIKAENDLWGCDQVERQIELLEQAIKWEQP